MVLKCFKARVPTKWRLSDQAWINDEETRVLTCTARKLSSQVYLGLARRKKKKKRKQRDFWYLHKLNWKWEAQLIHLYEYERVTLTVFKSVNAEHKWWFSSTEWSLYNSARSDLKEIRSNYKPEIDTPFHSPCTQLEAAKTREEQLHILIKNLVWWTCETAQFHVRSPLTTLHVCCSQRFTVLFLVPLNWL